MSLPSNRELLSLEFSLYGTQHTGDEVTQRLSILASLDAVRRSGDTWQLTTIGEDLLANNRPEDFVPFEYQPDVNASSVDVPFSIMESTNVLYEIDRDEGNAAEILSTEAASDETEVALPVIPAPQQDVMTFLAPDVESTFVKTSPAEPALRPIDMQDKDLQQYMHNVLVDTIRILFPITVNPHMLISRHSLDNVLYVGELNGKPNSWRGWSVNLASVDSGYRTIYIDCAENNLLDGERLRLFGDSFSQATNGMKSFVVVSVGGLHVRHRETVLSEGFIVMDIGQTLHACIVSTPEDFQAHSMAFWAAKVARLFNLQRALHFIDSRRQPPLKISYEPLSNGAHETKPVEVRGKSETALRKWLRRIHLIK